MDLFRQSSSPMSLTILRYPRLMLVKCEDASSWHGIIKVPLDEVIKDGFGPLRIHISDSSQRYFYDN